MQAIDETELLREYATRNSQTAFETLVSRHAGFVYSAALRQVRDPHLAEEVTQAVFIILAQKAGRLHEKTILSGWLFKTTRFVALAQVRTLARRHQYEKEAQLQSEVETIAADALWEQMSPLLDEALAQLGPKDRQAVLLRFFENKNLAEIGSSLGAGEDTARMRISRALEKLRRYFLKRGVVSTTAIIASVISANSVQAAPVALAKSITSVAMTKGVAASGSTLTLVKGALKIMAWTKIKTAVAGGVLILLATGTTTALIQHQRQQPPKPRPIASDQTEFPRPSWAFAGYANPESAFQSSMWAAGSGNAKILVAGLSPAMQQKLAGKSDAEILTAKDRADFARMTGYRILDKQVLSENEIVFDVYAEGLNETQKFSLQLVGNEWRFGMKAKP